jgi:hypothetical protein
MALWAIEITDRLTPALVGHAGGHYLSPPQSDEQARALLWLLLGAARKRGEPGPWWLAVPGGRREVRLHRLEKKTTTSKEARSCKRVPVPTTPPTARR